MQNWTGDLEEIVKQRDRLQKQVNDLERMADERDRLQQHVEQLQDAANERDQLREDLATLTEEHYSLQDRHDELDMRLMALIDSEEEIETKESESETELSEESKRPRRPEETKESKSETVMDEESRQPRRPEETKDSESKTEMGEESKQPRRPEAPKKLRYCNVCLKSVDKLSANVRLLFVKFEVCANLHYRLKRSMQTDAKPAYLNFYS